MKTKRHLMLDIETMNNSSDAAVIAIGARVFTLDGLGKGFETFIDSTKAGHIGTIGHETMAWWAAQKTRDLVFSGKIEPADAFHQFAEFCKQQKAEYIWANSPSFDCVILRHLAKQVNLKFPFHYRAERDCRTLFSIGRALEINCEDLWGNTERQGHLPLDDATTQAEVAARILKQIFSSSTAYSGPHSYLLQSAPGCSVGSTASTDEATGQ